MEHKNLISTLEFTPKEGSLGIFQRKFIHLNNYSIQIDFEKQQVNYGGSIVLESKTIQNFSQPENWVVLECVVRLLEKGYQPEDIVLEKTFKVGHGASGGRLDILVKKEGRAFLMIECKTYGKEYEKEFANLHKNGGQLLSYFQNDTSAEYLMLYASTLEDKEVKTQQAIVKIEDHYRDAGNVVDVFERWNKITLENGIFEPWVPAYCFENKRITKNDLIALDKAASSSLFHKFVSILRKHSVSDKPNAFNVIFDLFLAKLWDEKKQGNEEMEFQWRENKDDPVEFQYRLLKLYREGMQAFLEKEVEAIVDSEFKDADDEKKLKNIKKKILKLEKVFNIKSVIDDDSFEENHRVLKEIVELLQGYRIRYPRKQQHLSDFFELLLTTGLKQEAGQFFTPPPIARFIVRSLPIKETIKELVNQNVPQLPALIDYAAGSGHFLTEAMEEYQNILHDLDISHFKVDAKKEVEAWRINEYVWAAKYIYGVEKDHRLVKVAKVGCYFYGDGLAQVIHGDGLDNFEHSKSYRGLLKKNAKTPKFQFVLSNPPYSVSAFKPTLKAIHAEKDFDLFNRLTDRSSEIECLFVERTKQLLKPEGIAAIILPSSILSNGGICIQTREIVLKNFEIVAITELGSNTFMATGTNTVILFLKRRAEGVAEKIESTLSSFFSNFQDVTVNGIERPVSKYLSHVWETVSVEDYKTLLEKNPNDNIQEHEIYQEYTKKVKGKNEGEKRSKIVALEQEKLWYFILAYPQKIVLVKTGQKTKEKQFLGYEFSHRRGNEGMHPIQRGRTIDACTQLYDANSYENSEKASHYIYQAFNGNTNLEIAESLKGNISYQNLAEMLTFDRSDFEKNISLAVKKKVKIESRWEITKIREIAFTQYGYTDKATDNGEIRYLRITDLGDNGEIYLNNDIKFITPDEEVKKLFLLENDDIVIARSGSVGKAAIYKSDKYEEMIFASYLIRLQANKSKILPDYLFNFTKTKTYWNQVESNSIAVTQPNLNAEKIKNFSIPLPPLDIQQKIVDEIAVLEEQEKKALKEIESERKSIKSSSSVRGKHSKLEEIANIGSGGTPSKRIPKYWDNGNVPWLKSEVCREKDIHSAKDFITELGMQKSNAKYFEKDSTLIALVGATKGKTAFLKFKATTNQNIAGIKSLDTNKVLDKYIFYVLRNMYYYIIRDLGQYDMLNLTAIKNIQIPLPRLSEQQKIVSEIETIEEKIHELEAVIKSIPEQRNKVLENYLK